MASMIRKQVYLDPRHDRELKRMARESGKSEATIIREALDRLILDTRLEKERMEAWEAERAFMDQWMARGPVPAKQEPTAGKVGHQRRWRREDLYDRKGLR
jgi:hypothetical protein